MADLITHQEWKVGKKKNELKSPKNKQDIGPTLDKFHKSVKLKEKITLLQKIRAGFKVYKADNKDNAKAKKYLDELLKESNEKLNELKKDGLSDAAIATKVDAKCKTLELDEVWKDTSYKEQLKKFLKEGLGMENYNFLVAVEQRKGEWIYTTFVDPASSQAVNLTSQVLKDLKAQYDKNPKAVSYQVGYDEIWKLVRRDHLPRFRKWDPLRYAVGEKLGLL